jgi:hypothetical protein
MVRYTRSILERHRIAGDYLVTHKAFILPVGQVRKENVTAGDSQASGLEVFTILIP